METRKLLDNIITKNYDSYLRYAKRLCNKIDDPQDILQECIMYIYEIKDDKIEEILTYIDYYILQMIKFSAISVNSKYQRKYNLIKFDKTFNIEELKNIPVNEESYKIKEEDIMNILLTKCSWYEREVFLQYNRDNKTFKSFEEETGIPSSSLYKTYRKVKTILQTEIKKIKHNDK